MRWEQHLRKVVWPLDTPREQIPVGGYQPPPGDSPWQPRKAAVLVPIIAARQRRLLFTARAKGLTAHAGQVSFPGGGIEQHDADAVAAALRETEEEIGVSADFVEPVGLLDFFDTTSGFRILPVVALIRPGFSIQVDPVEVEAVFQVPGSVALDRRHYQSRTVENAGKSYRLWTLNHEGWVIWGATAGILMNLVKRLE